MQIYDKNSVPTRKTGRICRIQVTICYITDIQMNTYQFRLFCYSCYSLIPALFWFTTPLGDGFDSFVGFVIKNKED